MGKLINAISKNGYVACQAIDSTDIVSEMQQLHNTSGVVSAALGRLLTGSTLMASQLKGENEELTLKINGGGKAGTLIAVANAKNEVRGYAMHPQADCDIRETDHKLDVGKIVGTDGFLNVIRDQGLKEPYTGQVPIVSGEIAEDITSYFAISEQIPTVCSLGVLVNTDLTILNAGGFLLQLLPGAPDDVITKVEENVAKLPSITAMLSDGKTPKQIIEMVLDGLEPQFLKEQDVQYKCNCNRENIENILRSLGNKQLEEMIQEDPNAEVICHYCGKKYDFVLQNLLS